MRKVVVLLLLTGMLALAVAAGFAYMQQQIATPLSVDEPTLYSVEPGDSALTIVSDFSERGWSQMPPLMTRVWLKFFAGDTLVKAGTYQFDQNTTLPEAIRLMVAGEEHQFEVRLIEGLRLAQWLLTLQDHAAISYDINDDVLSELAIQWPYPPEGGLKNSEGLFLADTFHFTYKTKASVILQRAMNEMAKYLEQAWQQRAPGSQVATPYEALILASIIEKETAVEAERPHIAGVFANRLEKNMRLQTDPTVIYGLGDDFDGNLTRAHLRGKTAYNTYVIRGLPPTPIAMAGREAIDAAINPLPTDDLYFVARGDGSHKFSATLEEHNQAVYEYQIKPNRKE